MIIQICLQFSTVNPYILNTARLYYGAYCFISTSIQVDSALKFQMVLVEDEDVIVYSLPKQKSRPKNMYHSLKEARQNARILINKYQLKKNNLASFFLMILVTYPSIIVMFFLYKRYCKSVPRSIILCYKCLLRVMVLDYD